MGLGTTQPPEAPSPRRPSWWDSARRQTDVIRWTGRAGWAALALAVALLVVWALPAWVVRGERLAGPARQGEMAAVRTALIALLVAGATARGVAYTARTFRLSKTAYLTERFQKASEQLGSQSPIVSVAAVLALARLADEWEENRQECIDVLCAMLRSPPHTDEALAAEHDDVRRTALRVIVDHLQPTAMPSWRGRNLRLAGAQLRDADFSGVEFSDGTVSLGATFIERACFDDAVFSGACVDFQGASFPEEGVTFQRCRFRAGSVRFDEVEFTGPTLFDNAEFSAAGVVNFSSVWLGSGGETSFRYVTFLGSAPFAETRFESGVWFDHARFRAGATFDGAKFDGPVSFAGAEFTGGMLSFGILPDEKHTTFAAAVDFADATFRSTEVSLRGALGNGKLITHLFDGANPPRLREGETRPNLVRD
jgi:uncharacterized protein YjbI with pentapeptide repeats